VPNLRAYDPAYAYELAVIIQDGLKRMMTNQEDIFYYITMYNENYEQPPMLENSEDGILAGMYKVREAKCSGVPVQLLGSGTILKEAIKAQGILESYGVAADVWSVTSYQMLRREAMEVDRWNRLNPGKEARVPFVARSLQDGSGGPTVAVTDYITAVPDLVARWVPGLTCLGTDGYGRSDTKETLRKHFEIDAEAIAFTALSQLCRSGTITAQVAENAIAELKVDAEKPIQYFS
jgi:pyruvate dehydrogenase E1 component